MLFAMFFLYPLLSKYRKLFATVISPCLVLIILVFLYQKSGATTPSAVWMGLFYKGTLRAIAEISLGVTAYEFVNLLNRVSLTRIGKAFVFFIEVICYVTTIVVACTNTEAKWYFIRSCSWINYYF